MNNKGGNVKVSLAGITVLMLIFTGQACASFKKCFPRCAIGCLLREHKLFCALECLAECLIEDDAATSSRLGYCKLGCAIHRCAAFADEFDIEDVEKVDGCVNECEIGECGFLSKASIAASPQKLSPAQAQSPR